MAPKRSRGSGPDARTVERIAKYQAQGLSSNEALAREKAAGRGMRRQAWHAVYGAVKRDEFLGVVPKGGRAPLADWPVQQPGGYLYFVVVATTPRGRSNRVKLVRVTVGPKRRRISDAAAVREAVESLRRADERYKSRIMFGYVSSVARRVKK